MGDSGLETVVRETASGGRSRRGRRSSAEAQKEGNNVPEATRVRLKPDATSWVRLKPDATSWVRLKPDATSSVRLKPDATIDV